MFRESFELTRIEYFEMFIKSLKDVKMAALVKCFNLAFSDYFVKMPTTIDFWEERWKAARVDYSLSFGMFDEKEIVGFIINGIDFKENTLTAFNTGTGVLPKYRGRKIVKKLYNFANPEFLKKGVKKCSLEVITENEKALKAYLSIGFKITNILKCYSGTLKVTPSKDLTLVSVEFDKINWENLPNQEFYSWDNHRNALSILEKDYKCFEVFEQAKRIGYFIVNPQTGSLAQFDLLDEKKMSNWPKLFAGIKIIVPEIKINNVDERQIEKINVIGKVGLNHVIDQYEMEFIIKTEN